MEKYAVDLEKVLDDFEFEEKHLRKYSSEQRAIDDSLSCDYTTNENIYPRAYRTPAANYRRPPFEPMNLADADFSVSQISRSYNKVKTSDMQTEHESNFKQSIAAVPRSDSEFIPTVQHSASIDYSFTFNLKDKNDYKPDLIESNAGICSNSDEFSHIERHLPDIASADMISTVKETSASVDVDGNENGDLFEGKNMLPTQMKPKAKVISFQISQNVTDDALHQYLEELVEDDDMNSQNRMIEKSIETPEDSADMCSISELEGKVGKETECSSSDNLEAPKSSCSSENCNPDYGILSDNVLLISSSVESQENLEYDNTENDMEGDRLIPNNDAKYVDDPLQSNVPCVSCADYEIFTTAGRTECTRSCGDGTLFESAENQPGSRNARPNESESDFESEKFHQIECIYVSTKCVDSNVDNVEKYSHSSRSAITGACERYEVAEAIDFDDVGKDKDVDDDSKERKHVDIVALPAMYDNEMVEHDNPAFGNPSQIIAKHKELNTRSVCDQNFTKLESKMAVLNFDPVRNILNAESQIMESSASLDVHYASTATLVSHRKDDVNDDHEGDDNDNSHERDDHEGEEHFTESETGTNVRSAESLAGTSQAKPQRPDFLDLPQNIQNADMSSTSADSGSLLSAEERKLGKEPPYWMPDSDTIVCMHCQLKFNPVIRRRHHCRACGLVVCAKCSDRKASLEYLGFKEDRVCHTCHSILQKINNVESESSAIMKRPNPNNPMEYCSKIPPLLQVGSTHHPTPSVLVPKVGVLKREGRAKTNDSPKQVIFSDGIRPGGDLTELDASPEQPRLPLRRSSRITKRVGTPPAITDVHRRLLNPETRSFIPSGSVDLPPLVTKIQGEYVYSELETALNVKNDAVEFAINRNLFVVVCRLILDCCVHKEVWCVTSEGLSCVGQDEIVFIVEALPEERHPPKDVFTAINTLYQDASKGSTVTEMSYMPPHNNQLFGSKEHGGFVFIRPTYQCVQKLRLPKPPFLIALLIHRWETPWARLFPIRLVLRLGAEYRYYPCPLVSVRNRPALFSEIGHTIFTLLADFRKYTYTLPTVRGLMIHMEDRLTTILLPKNRYDQIIRALNNSEENVLAFAGNISTIADSHLVCIQSTQQEDTGYQTQAINILNKPRQVTGASFVVFNGSLKQCGWSGKSNIVEDGLMVQIPSESMTALRNALRQMKNYSIGCGPQAEEMVVLKWAPDDVNFNIGVKSEIDNRTLNGIPSIRVHNGTDYSGILRLIRWTEVFIIQSDEENNSRTGDSINISKLSESVAKSTCVALLPLLDLLAAANLTTIAVRVTIHPENVGYEAGSKGEKLPPIYMKSLDEELVGIINKAAVSIGDVANPVILELIFKVMEQG